MLLPDIQSYIVYDFRNEANARKSRSRRVGTRDAGRAPVSRFVDTREATERATKPGQSESGMIALTRGLMSNPALATGAWNRAESVAPATRATAFTNL